MSAAAAMTKMEVLKDGKLVVSLVFSLRNVVGAQQMVQPDGWSNRSSATRVRREQISAPPIASGRNDGLKNEGIRRKRSVGRSLFSSRVDRTGLRSHVISKLRCRANSHGIFQTSSTAKQKMVGFSCLLAGMISSSVIRLHVCLQCGVVILSEFLSPNFDLNSFTVRNVLHGWIAHDDVAAVWLTQPSTSSTAVSSQNMSSSKRCRFPRGAYQQYGSSVFRALYRQRLWQSLYQWICVPSGLPFRKRSVLL